MDGTLIVLFTLLLVPHITVIVICSHFFCVSICDILVAAFQASVGHEFLYCLFQCIGISGGDSEHFGRPVDYLYFLAPHKIADVVMLW